MKKLFLTIISMLAMATCVMAQETIVINGQVIPVSKIKSMSYGVSNQQLPEVMKRDEKIKLFTEALFATKLNEKLYDYSDRDYSVGADSTTWLNEALCINVATEYDNVAYPAKRYYQFTAFAETDEVLKDKYGISTLDDLRKKAHELYDPMYPEDKSVTDETDPRNALNRFVAYHFLEGKMAHNKFVQHMCEYGYKYGDIMNPQQKEFSIDVWDYFTTVGKHRGLVKILQEAVSHDLFANRTCKYDIEGSYEQTAVLNNGVQILPTNGDNDNNARNGFYFPIDDLFLMDAKTADALGNERIRFDITTILPELMNSGARNVTYMYFDDNDYFSNITGCSDDTKLLYLTSAPVGGTGWCDYEGDEFMVLGVYDFTLKLPPVPKDGTYELRMGVSQNSLRGMCQIYFGDDAKSLLPVGLPYDMRNQYLDQDENVAWFNDTNLDEGTIIEKDKNMRNHGYMKGPKYFNRNDGTGNNTARDYSGNVRRIITTQNLKADKTYYIRFKTVLDRTTAEFYMDGLEYCPKEVYDNPEDPEDIW